MKTRTFVAILILVLAVLIVVGSCATGKKAYKAKEDEEIYGTWVNPDYNYSQRSPGKVIFYPNGKFEDYVLDTDISTSFHGDFVITDKSIDSKGNIWYKIIVKLIDEKYGLYLLTKISNSKNTLEMNMSSNDYPKEINPDDRYTKYNIFYRQ